MQAKVKKQLLKGLLALISIAAFAALIIAISKIFTKKGPCASGSTYIEALKKCKKDCQPGWVRLENIMDQEECEKIGHAWHEPDHVCLGAENEKMWECMKICPAGTVCTTTQNFHEDAGVSHQFEQYEPPAGGGSCTASVGTPNRCITCPTKENPDGPPHNQVLGPACDEYGNQWIRNTQCASSKNSSTSDFMSNYFCGPDCKLADKANPLGPGPYSQMIGTPEAAEKNFGWTPSFVSMLTQKGLSICVGGDNDGQVCPAKGDCGAGGVCTQFSPTAYTKNQKATCYPDETQVKGCLGWDVSSAAWLKANDLIATDIPPLYRVGGEAGVGGGANMDWLCPTSANFGKCVCPSPLKHCKINSNNDQSTVCFDPTFASCVSATNTTVLPGSPYYIDKTDPNIGDFQALVTCQGATCTTPKGLECCPYKNPTCCGPHKACCNTGETTSSPPLPVGTLPGTAANTCTEIAGAAANTDGTYPTKCCPKNTKPIQTAGDTNTCCLVSQLYCPDKTGKGPLPYWSKKLPNGDDTGDGLASYPGCTDPANTLSCCGKNLCHDKDGSFSCCGTGEANIGCGSATLCSNNLSTSNPTGFWNNPAAISQQGEMANKCISNIEVLGTPPWTTTSKDTVNKCMNPEYPQNSTLDTPGLTPTCYISKKKCGKDTDCSNVDPKDSCRGTCPTKGETPVVITWYNPSHDATKTCPTTPCFAGGSAVSTKCYDWTFADKDGGDLNPFQGTFSTTATEGKACNTSKTDSGVYMQAVSGTCIENCTNWYDPSTPGAGKSTNMPKGCSPVKCLSGMACFCDTSATKQPSTCMDTKGSFTSTNSWPGELLQVQNRTPPGTVKGKAMPIWGQTFNPGQAGKYCPLNNIPCSETNDNCPSYYNTENELTPSTCVASKCMAKTEYDLNGNIFCPVNYRYKWPKKLPGSASARSYVSGQNSSFMSGNEKIQPGTKTAWLSHTAEVQPCDSGLSQDTFSCQGLINYDSSGNYVSFPPCGTGAAGIVPGGGLGACGGNASPMSMSFPFVTALGKTPYSGPCGDKDCTEATSADNMWSCVNRSRTVLGCDSAVTSTTGAAGTMPVFNLGSDTTNPVALPSKVKVDGVDFQTWNVLNKKSWTAAKGSSPTAAQCQFQALASATDGLKLDTAIWNSKVDPPTCAAEYSVDETATTQPCDATNKKQNPGCFSNFQGGGSKADMDSPFWCPTNSASVGTAASPVAQQPGQLGLNPGAPGTVFADHGNVNLCSPAWPISL